LAVSSKYHASFKLFTRLSKALNVLIYDPNLTRNIVTPILADVAISHLSAFGPNVISHLILDKVLPEKELADVESKKIHLGSRICSFGQAPCRVTEQEMLSHRQAISS